jgi:hypothetical protein
MPIGRASFHRHNIAATFRLAGEASASAMPSLETALSKRKTAGKGDLPDASGLPLAHGLIRRATKKEEDAHLQPSMCTTDR